VIFSVSVSDLPRFPESISAEQLTQLRQQGNVTVLDVRTPPEYTQLGHLPGAELMPLQVLDQQFSTLDPTHAYIVVCEHGVRSMHACHFLASQGFTALYNLSGGMAIWTGEREYTGANTLNTNALH
jgi:rhodanese-related sulfurtransferase